MDAKECKNESRIVESTSDESPGSRWRFMQFAIDNLSDATYWIEEDGSIVQVNQAACQMLGFSEAEFSRLRMVDLNTELGSSGWSRAWSLLKQYRKRTFQTKHRAKDGRVIPVEISANLVEIEGREYSCAFARDITDRMQLEVRLRQAEKMEAIGRLAGGVAHDFNNQLAVILGNAEILSDALGRDKSNLELVEAILHSARRSADLTSQLLAFSRQGKYVQTQVDLHEIIDETCAMLARGLDKRISIDRSLDAPYSMVEGDATQLQNAVLNLAINARDAMFEHGGKLIFSTENVHLDEPFQVRHGLSASAGEHIKLRISDTGHGMSDLTLDRLFEPFFTTKEAGKGTGLGLAAVYGTIKLHRGAIVVGSKLGQGSSFELYLPALLIAGNRRVQSTKPVPVKRLGMHVLLVEDEAPVRLVTERMLTHLGCRVTAVDDGPRAVAFYEQAFHEVDVVILDMVMPEMDGQELYRRMKEIHPGIRAILASGFSIDGVAHSMLESGVRGYLQKPYSREALAQKIAEVMGR